MCGTARLILREPATLPDCDRARVRLGHDSRGFRFLLLCLDLLLFAYPLWGGACPNLIDCTPSHAHKNGIWSLAEPGLFPAVLIGASAAGALWEGDQTRLGNTLWQSLDAAAAVFLA